MLDIREAKLYKVSEVAKILGIQDQDVKYRIRTGELKAIPKKKKMDHYRIPGYYLKKYLNIE